jgi:hypothetical protein
MKADTLAFLLSYIAFSHYYFFFSVQALEVGKTSNSWGKNPRI